MLKMEKSEIKAQAEAYCENPKAWRKSAEGQKAFSELPAPVQAKVREILRVAEVSVVSMDIVSSAKTLLKSKLLDPQGKA